MRLRFRELTREAGIEIRRRRLGHHCALRIDGRQKRSMVVRNFGLGSIVNLALGMGLYGTVFILPLCLGRVHGYGATQIAEVILWMGLPQLAIIPSHARHSRGGRCDPASDVSARLQRLIPDT